MNRRKISVILIFLLYVVSFLRPQTAKSEELANHDIWQQETLTNGFWGLNDSLSDIGIELGLSATQLYQQNVHGGMSTHRRSGRYSGSYDLELTANMQRLLGIKQ